MNWEWPVGNIRDGLSLLTRDTERKHHTRCSLFMETEETVQSPAELYMTPHELDSSPMPTLCVLVTYILLGKGLLLDNELMTWGERTLICRFTFSWDVTRSHSRMTLTLKLRRLECLKPILLHGSSFTWKGEETT